MFLMHIPIMEFRDRAALFECVSPFPHTLSLSAHRHRHEHFFIDETEDWTGVEPHHHIVHGTACGSWYRGPRNAVGIPEAVMADGTPKGYSILTIDDNAYSMEYRASKRPADYQMDIHAPNRLSRAQASKQQVTVNFFNGTPRCSVEMRLNNGPWIPMEQYTGQAPFYQELLDRQNLFLQLVAGMQNIDPADEKAIKRIEEQFRPAIGRGMPGIDDTPHLWRALLPETDHVGFAVIEAQAKDMFGRTHKATRCLYLDE